ncbi:flagellar M-ring protein FliF [Loktanella sp. F6476L]|uniref:flagellar basal-body MS-ring/collar protein FliF n=1 Tax=Loktanella sp. F6476L TaxID=2926405 RepID=UPI001FF5DFFC|nr:flagellar basal-body MS-ring/collar protein FliF [Loktanella sp. F6476L]MCK0120398.1 flagellar M-ring protein FliF [Loktanella sp. F6476L]
MQNLLDVWNRLSIGQRVAAIGSSIGVFLVVLFLVQSPGARDMSLLFGGLEPSAAGDVLTALDQQGVIYEVRGGAIYVETTARDSLRLVLAGQGLPVSGVNGYELLDNLSGFSTTSQMFDATYWRAKEGELARTIVANPRFRSARVHISSASTRSFQRSEPPSAAVTVQSSTGIISANQVKALQYLVASAVSGLVPENVAIIDATAGLLSGADDLPGAAADNEQADILRARAERLLLARVGAGNAVVELTMETVTDSETISERTVDPDSRVAISTEVQESAEKSEDSRGGDVTVASNLPDGDAAGGGTANNENSETRALTNFEVSETQREIRRLPGAVKRLTVAVLINDAVIKNPDGTTTVEPRSDEELADLQELVTSAVGFDEARGDQITLRSMPFEPIPELGTEVFADSTSSSSLDMMQLIQIGVLAAVALILGLFVVKPILSPKSGMAALPPPDEGAESTSFVEDDGPQMMSAFPDMMSIEGPSDDGLGFGDMGGRAADDPVTRLQEMITDRETETLQILENWMDDPERKEPA